MFVILSCDDDNDDGVGKSVEEGRCNQEHGIHEG